MLQQKAPMILPGADIGGDPGESLLLTAGDDVLIRHPLLRRDAEQLIHGADIPVRLTQRVGDRGVKLIVEQIPARWR